MLQELKPIAKLGRNPMKEVYLKFLSTFNLKFVAIYFFNL